MKRYLNIKCAAIMRMFVLVLAVGLTGNAFAAKKDVATQADLDAAVAAQATVDTGQNTTISAQGASISALQAEIASLKALVEKYHPIPRKIGDFYGGGVIFYVNDTGQHGLIASLTDQSTGTQWYNGVYKATGATGAGIGAGITNTAIIVATQNSDNPNGNFAAKLAADFSIQGDGMTPCTGSADEICHGDWYLPSSQELHMLSLYQHIIGGFPSNTTLYWSSTECDELCAYAVGIPAGGIGDLDKSNLYRVRAIRAF